MNIIDVIETRVRGFIEDIQHPNQKKKININDLELQLRKLLDDYFEMDGYSLFYQAIETLQAEEQLIPIQNNQYNGRIPALPLFYWVNTKVQTTKWDRLEMMKLNDQFDFSYYERYPQWQTKDEWERILHIYTFLQSSQERDIVSLEERSLELFGHEKFLIDSDLFPDGKGFLARIGITEDQLKVVNYGEPFVFWMKQGKEMKDIKRVLIVENLSFFHTSIKLLEDNQLDYEPELIIYGEGTKIERSFSFFFRMFPLKSYLFYYAGDLDAAGYGIFIRLIEKYPDCSIQPALKIYRKMLDCLEQRNDQKIGQTQNSKYRDLFFQWFTEEEQALLLQLWQENKRIPQEVLTIETWRRWM
ncbi:Wadjet anti-phage system protein JetD domain-containing protein [Metabacillus sediminilitoris]|uniref:Permease n=1 Tax=Metabacillus sediminilitoris TaxID=2567941 RepID=A0A4S4BTQ6_9BACI|nr:Wadjet anti-phage system protein JetD domain-containing protein [Metabacillus sediminilitoris]QGQ45446.1 permease [Metabacillus sediminilitoris]THF77697.1 permease [Metabacillus sediminilitoris]